MSKKCLGKGEKSMGIISRLRNKVIKKKDPVAYWRKMGAKIGGGV